MPSKILLALPELLSTMAGIRPFAGKTWSARLLAWKWLRFWIRLISRNHASFCSFLEMSILCTLYATPSSSIVQETFCPLGVPAVYLYQCQQSLSYVTYYEDGKADRYRSICASCFAIAGLFTIGSGWS